MRYSRIKVGHKYNSNYGVVTVTEKQRCWKCVRFIPMNTELTQGITPNELGGYWLTAKTLNLQPLVKKSFGYKVYEFLTELARVNRQVRLN